MPLCKLDLCVNSAKETGFCGKHKTVKDRYRFKIKSLEIQLKEARGNLQIASRIGIRLIRRAENKIEFDAETLTDQMKILSDMYDLVSITQPTTDTTTKQNNAEKN